MQPLVAIQLGIVETCLSLQPPAAAEAAEAGAERCSLFTLSSTSTDSGLGTDSEMNGNEEIKGEQNGNSAALKVVNGKSSTESESLLLETAVS